jgi:hypothetical protein
MRSVRKCLGFVCVALSLAAFCIAEAARGCETCDPSDAWAVAPPFDQSAAIFSAFTLGLEEGAAAPLVFEMGATGQRAVLMIYAGQVSEEIAALRLAAEGSDALVIAALSGFSPFSVETVRGLVGEDVVLIGDPLADQIRSAYWVGKEVAGTGITFFIDEHGTIALRRGGSPVWLIEDGFAAVKLFASDGIIPDAVWHQYVLEQGEVAPPPSFILVDESGATLDWSDDRARFLYDGPAPDTEKGALILDAIDALRIEFPAVEFVWHLNYKSDAQLDALWTLYDSADMADLHPEWFGLPFEEYCIAVRDARDENLCLERESILAAAEGWRIVLDPGNELGVLWCLRFSPCMMVIDRNGAVALPPTLFPTNSVGGALRIHPGAQEALRQILREIGGP